MEDKTRKTERRNLDSILEDLYSTLRDLSKEYSKDNLVRFILSFAEYIRQGFSELGIDYLKAYQTLIRPPKRLYIINEVYLGIDNPNEIINTYELDPKDFYDSLREMEELGLISYDGRRIKMTEKGIKWFESLRKIPELLKTLENIIVRERGLDLSDPLVRQWLEDKVCKKQDDEERKGIWLDLSDPTVREYYEYLKKKFEEEEKRERK